jgi:hypothetical protein
MIEAGFSPLELYLIGFSKEEIITESGENCDLELFSNLLEHAKNPAISADERIIAIKNMFNDINVLTLYWLRENKVPLHLIIKALDNLENIFYYLNYVFTLEDFVKEQEEIPLDYYAAKFPHNDFLYNDISAEYLVSVLYKDKPTKFRDSQVQSIKSSFAFDDKIQVKIMILNNNNLKSLLKDYNVKIIKETLEYYFRVYYMTPLHPWYKSFKKINDEIYKKDNGLSF